MGVEKIVFEIINQGTPLLVTITASWQLVQLRCRKCAYLFAVFIHSFVSPGGHGKKFTQLESINKGHFIEEKQ